MKPIQDGVRRTLRAELAADERFEGQRLPVLSSIAEFLKEQEMTRPYERHSELPQSHGG